MRSAKSFEISRRRAALLTLHQHKLTQKASKQSILRIIGDLCGLQAQTRLSPEVGLWNRIQTYSKGQLESLLYGDRTLAKIWCMRGTQHIVPSEDLPVFLQGTRQEWLEWSAKDLIRQKRWPRQKRLERIYPLLSKILQEGPKTRSEVRESLLAAGIPQIELSEYGLAKESSYLGFTVSGPPLGGSGGEQTLTLLSQWLPRSDPDSISASEARRILLKRYFRSYGPASLTDASYFLGIRMSSLQPAFGAINDETIPVRVEGEKGEKWITKDSGKTLDRLDEDLEVPLRFLAAYDQLLLGHKNKTRFVPPKHLRCIYLPSANMAHSILLDGTVVGTWRWNKTRQGVRIKPRFFVNPTGMVRRKIRDEIGRLGHFLSPSD